MRQNNYYGHGPNGCPGTNLIPIPLVTFNLVIYGRPA